jgi:hypothetical protein
MIYSLMLLLTLLYNLGQFAFFSDDRIRLSLNTCSAARCNWVSLTDSNALQKVMAKLTIKILSGMMVKG